MTNRRPISPFRYEKLMECTHCGLCLPLCPTYRELRVEMDSPRGRIYLVRALEDGRVGVTKRLASHLDLCVGCLACETACPSDVSFGNILGHGRSLLGRASTTSGLLSDLFYQSVLPRKSRIVALGRLLRFLQSRPGEGINVASRLETYLPGNLGHAFDVLTALPSEPTTPFESVYTPRVPNGRRVGLLVCCMMRVYLTRVNDATIRVLNRGGHEVVVPASQECCGALHAHAGRLSEARHLAEVNIRAFENAGVDFILTNSAGCGAHMKQYPYLFDGDAHWEARAQSFSERVQDISEFLFSIGPLEGLGKLPHRVAYDDPCHLLHGQGVREEPRQLLRQIPALQLVDLKEPDWCCGSAGTFMFTQKEMALKLLDRKLEAIGDSGAEIVATGNPGCLLWIEWGLQRAGSAVKCLHPIELLDMAYQ